MADLSKLSTDELLAMHAKAVAAPSDASDLSKIPTEQLLKMHAEATAEPKSIGKWAGSSGDALTRGIAQGATFGFADEATGAVGGLYDYVMGKLHQRGDIDLRDAYNARRETARRGDVEAKKEHPYVYNTGQAAGAVGTAVVPGLGALNVGKGAGVAQVIGKGALQGAIAGAGGANDLTDVPQDMATGAITGGAIGGTMYGVGKLVAPIAKALTPNALNTAAEQRAFKAAVGNQQKITEEIANQGRTNEIGRELLDSGVVGFGDRAADIAKNASALKSKAGGDIDRILTAVDTQSGQKLVDGHGIADNLRAYAQKIGGEGNASTIHRLEELAQSYEQRGPMSLLEAQVEKNSFKYRHGDPGATFDKEATNTIKGIIGDEMEQGVNRLTGGPAAPTLAEYLAAKNQYGAGATASTGAKKLAAREAKNATVGLLPTITGAAAAAPGIAKAIEHGSPALAAGSALLGGAVMAGHKLAQTRGNSALAVGLDKAANLSEAVSPYVAPVVNTVSAGVPRAATQFYLDLNNPMSRNVVPQSDPKKDAILRRINSLGK
jgi:hypothetical protein